MHCPRCSRQLGRPELIEHLWLEHRLLLADGQVREPWPLIEEWIAGCAARPDPARLAHCLELARRLEPPHGLLRVQRLMLAHGIDDPEARRSLLAAAGQQRASLCPRCYALVPPPLQPEPLTIFAGQLSSNGYRVAVAETGLFTHLRLATPQVVLHDGPEPERRLTDRGVQLLVTAPLIVAALLLAVLLSGSRRAALLLVVALVLAAVITHLVVRIRREPLGTALDRAVDYAWTLLVPRLHAEGLSAADAGFIAGLALVSIDRGHAETRQPVLGRVLKEAEAAVLKGASSLQHLAWLWRLTIADAAATGRDPVILVVRQVERTLRGQLPLRFAEHLLAGWQCEFWTPGNLGRLRVLLCERAFEAGLEVPDLLELERLAPGLADALHTEDIEGLTALRLLWTLRVGRPWERWSQALTVFELAERGDLDPRFLGDTPDLLLSEAPGSARSDDRFHAAILVCVRGLILQKQLFTLPPAPIEVKPARRGGWNGHELTLGPHTFWFREPPHELARRLEHWIRYFFTEFITQARAVRDWRSLGQFAQLQTREMRQCPECGQSFPDTCD